MTLPIEKSTAKSSETKSRPLATGEVSSREALGLFGFLALIAFVLVLFLNKTVIMLSVVGIIFYHALPIYEALDALTASVFGDHLEFVDTHGLCGSE